MSRPAGSQCSADGEAAHHHLIWGVCIFMLMFCSQLACFVTLNIAACCLTLHPLPWYPVHDSNLQMRRFTLEFVQYDIRLPYATFSRTEPCTEGET